ncbi:hypothetical protein I4U23_003967 [Adineta vaga]|nr:hypothetical protein I4U23_003967 [Adineta vaga]
MDQFDSFETDDKSVIDPQLKKILHFYAHQWEKYRISTQKETNANDVYELFPITINIWRKVLFQPLHEQITQACLQLINSERNKQVIPTHLIGAVIQSYVALNSASSTFKVLKNSFGTQFLAGTQKFYRLEAINFLIDHSVTEYLKKVVARFDEEEQRVRSYLHPSLLQPLIENLENILIRDRLDLIYDEAKILIRDERYHDLALLFKLISRIPDAANGLKEIVRNHISEIGVNSIKNISKTTIIDPKVYIDTIVDVHHKYFKVVLDVFNNDPKFLVSFHQRTLRKRLLGQLSISEDHEKMLISKLKDTCGYEYTVELERMYQDFCISQTITDEYRNDCERKESILKESLREKCSVGFSVMVLSSNIWLLSDSTNLLLPIELKTTFDQFNEFYTNRHPNRKLTWIHQQSKGELEISFHPKKYLLQVSLYQMTILLLFNQNSNYWTVEKLYDATLINSDILKQTLCNLSKNKILICENITNKQVEDLDETNIEMNYSIKLADQFYNKKFKLNLNIPRKSNEQKSIQDVHTQIDVDREMNVQATIIRIMKTRQTLKYSLLIQEVLSQNVSYFKPEIPIIEKCITLLIEKDYLARSSNEKDVLHYLA